MEEQLMTPEMVQGLKSLNRDDLTPEEIAAIEQADDIAEKTKEELEQNTLENLAELLSNFENAPTLYDLEGWKDQWGVIHMSSVSGEDIYIWRTIRRQEYKQMAKTGMLNEKTRMEDTIVRKCLLYPEPKDKFMSTSGAGIIPTLKDQIMYQSGFISEREALSLIKII